MEELYKEAMEALQIHDYLSDKGSSDDLLCECNPISYKQVSDYLDSNNDNNLKCDEIMEVLRIAQGCGTCFNAASEFIELKQNQIGNEIKNSQGES